MESKRSPSRSAELSFLPSQSLRFIKAMWALRAFILLPLAAASRSTSEALTTGLGPVGRCEFRGEDTPRAHRNGQAVRQCRMSKWEHCTGKCRWRSGEVPAGYCDYLYPTSKREEERSHVARQCRHAAHWHDCVGECRWVKSNTSQPHPDGACLSKYEGSPWAQKNGAAVRQCRVTKKWEDCVGLCRWKRSKLKIPEGYCDFLYPDSKLAEERSDEVRRC